MVLRLSSLGLGGLAPSSHSIGLGGFPLSQADFRDFREHGPRMRIDDLDAPYGEFVARAPTYVFSRGPSRTLTSSMQAASNLAASVLVVPVAPPLAPAGAYQKKYFSRTGPVPCPPGFCRHRSEKHFPRPLSLIHI